MYICYGNFTKIPMCYISEDHYLLGYKRHAVLCKMGKGLLTGYLTVLTFSLFVLDYQIVYLTKKSNFNSYKLY